MAGFAIVLACGLAGCTSMGPTQTGFLPDYSNLARTTAFMNWGGGSYRVRVKLPTPGELDAIDSFYIAPVEWAANERDWLGPNDDRRERVMASMEQGLRDRLVKIRPVVDAPGPRTATVRAAVTDVMSARPVVNALAMLVLWGPVSNGGASVEAEVRAPDGHQIAAVDGGSHGGFLDVVGYFTRSGHPKRNARRLAGELGDAVEGKQVGHLRGVVGQPTTLDEVPTVAGGPAGSAR